MTIDDVEVEVFELFVHWLYAQDLPQTAIDMHHGEDITAIKALLLLWLKAVVFGDRFLAPGFKKAAHNRFINHSGTRRPWYELVTFAYKSLPNDSLILEYMVDAHACFWTVKSDGKKDVQERSKVPRRFLVDVMARQQVLRYGTEPWEEGDFSLCAHHLHDSEMERKSCPTRIGQGYDPTDD